MDDEAKTRHQQAIDRAEARIAARKAQRDRQKAKQAECRAFTAAILAECAKKRTT